VIWQLEGTSFVILKTFKTMENKERNDFAEAFRQRTKKFVADNIKLFRTLPKTEEAKIIGRQLLRSSSSVGSNYRAACRARS